MRISNEEFSYTLNDQRLGASLSLFSAEGSKGQEGGACVSRGIRSRPIVDDISPRTNPMYAVASRLGLSTIYFCWHRLNCHSETVIWIDLPGASVPNIMKSLL